MKTWRLWLQHNSGGGMNSTRETCKKVNFEQAMDWAYDITQKYQLHHMSYIVKEVPEEVLQRVKHNGM